MFIRGHPLTPESTNVLIQVGVDTPPLPIYRMSALPLHPSFALVQTKAPEVSARGPGLDERRMIADWTAKYGEPPPAKTRSTIKNDCAKISRQLRGEKQLSIEMVQVVVYMPQYPGRVLTLKLFNDNTTYIQVLAVRQADLEDAREAVRVFLDACEELEGSPISRDDIKFNIGLLNVVPLNIEPPEGTWLSLEGFAKEFVPDADYDDHGIRIDTLANPKGTEIAMRVRYRGRPQNLKDSMSVQVYAAGTMSVKAAKTVEEVDAFCASFEERLRRSAAEIFPRSGGLIAEDPPAVLAVQQLLTIKLAWKMFQRGVMSAEKFQETLERARERILARYSDDVGEDEVHDDGEQ